MLSGGFDFRTDQVSQNISYDWYERTEYNGLFDASAAYRVLWYVCNRRMEQNVGIEHALVQCTRVSRYFVKQCCTASIVHDSFSFSLMFPISVSVELEFPFSLIFCCYKIHAFNI